MVFMADLFPIPGRSWICHELLKQHIRPMYGKQHLRLCYLPQENILPEHIAAIRVMDVELMIACLRGGAWLQEDWQPYVRYTIAKRLRMRSSLLFTAPFAEIKDEFLEYQLNGGTFKQQDSLKKFVTSVMRHPNASEFHVNMCRLMASTFDGVTDNTLIQPFHWIRAALARTESNPVFGLTLFNSEMMQQKLTLVKMLRARLT